MVSESEDLVTVRAKIFAVGSVDLVAFTRATDDVCAMAVQQGVNDVISSDGADALQNGEIEVGCALPGPRVTLPAVEQLPGQPVEQGLRMVPLHACIQAWPGVLLRRRAGLAGGRTGERAR